MAPPDYHALDKRLGADHVLGGEHTYPPAP